MRYLPIGLAAVIAGGATHGDTISTITYDITRAPFNATCDGVHDDRAAFDLFNRRAVAAQGSSQILLNIPAGHTCCFIASGLGGGSAFAKGINNFILDGHGSTLTDDCNGVIGAGYFLGSNGTYFDNRHYARTATASAGSSSVRLLDKSKCSLFAAGQYALMAGLDQQGYGDPANPYFFEWVLVSSTSSCPGSGVINLSAPLTYTYLSTWPVYNTGDFGHSDLGGPATLYAVHPAWNTTQLYKNLVFIEHGTSINSNGRVITFDNVSTASSSCIIPSQNQTWTVQNSDLTNCGTTEADKIVTNMVVKNTTGHTFLFQSGSVVNFTMTGGSLFNLNGTPQNATLSEVTLSNFTTGPTAFGTAKTISCTNCNISMLTPGGVTDTASGIGVYLAYTMRGGVITIPPLFHVTNVADNGSGLIRLTVDSTKGYTSGQWASLGGAVLSFLGGVANWQLTVIDGTHFDLVGSTYTRGGKTTGNAGFAPVQWGIPGANIVFARRYTPSTQAFQITGVTQDLTGTHIATNWPAGTFPTLPTAGAPLGIRTHPGPVFNCSGCFGSADALDLAGAPANAPLWSYSSRVVTGSYKPATVPVWGNVISITFNGTVAYAGSSTINVELDGPFVLDDIFAQRIWDPRINPKNSGGTPHTVVVTPTTAVGTQTGDSVIPPGAGTLLLSDQLKPKFSAVPIDIGATSVTVTIQADQNVVPQP